MRRKTRATSRRGETWHISQSGAQRRLSKHQEPLLALVEAQDIAVKADAPLSINVERTVQGLEPVAVWRVVRDAEGVVLTIPTKED